MTPASNRLVALVAAPHGAKDTAMINDVVAMSQAATDCGLAQSEIIRLSTNSTMAAESHHSVSREHLENFLENVGRHISQWKSGHMLLHYAGHGALIPQASDPGRYIPGLKHGPTVEDEDCLSWDDVWHIIDPPAGVTLTVLPDS